MLKTSDHPVQAICIYGLMEIGFIIVRPMLMQETQDIGRALARIAPMFRVNGKMGHEVNTGKGVTGRRIIIMAGG
jgi:hypothetical protein